MILIVLRKTKKYLTYKVLHDTWHPLSTKSKFKKHFFLGLAKSGRSGQYLTGTGPDLKESGRIDRNRISGHTLDLKLQF